MLQKYVLLVLLIMPMFIHLTIFAKYEVVLDTITAINNELKTINDNFGKIKNIKDRLQSIKNKLAFISDYLAETADPQEIEAIQDTINQLVAMQDRIDRLMADYDAYCKEWWECVGFLLHAVSFILCGR